MLTSYPLDVTGRTDTNRLDKACSFGVCSCLTICEDGSYCCVCYYRFQCKE